MSILIIPAIDLREGRCVRLTQGRKEDEKVYAGDAVEIAQRYQDDGARMLHVVDLDGAFSESNSRNRQVLREITRKLEIPTQFGGGLRSIPDVEQVIELGVTRVVIGTLAAESPDGAESPGILEQLVARFGSRICVGIDAYEGRVMTRGWEKEETLSALELALRVAALGVERIIYTDVARDGMLTGVNVEQTCIIARESGLEVTASGGVSSLADLKRLQCVSEAGIDSVIIGKALYEGRFTLKQALEAVEPTE